MQVCLFLISKKIHLLKGKKLCTINKSETLTFSQKNNEQLMIDRVLKTSNLNHKTNI